MSQTCLFSLIDVEIKITPPPSTKDVEHAKRFSWSLDTFHVTGSGLFMERTRVSSRCGQERWEDATQNASCHSKNHHFTKTVRDVEFRGSREAFRWDGWDSGGWDKTPAGVGVNRRAALTLAGLHVNTLVHTHLNLHRAKTRT